MRNKLIHFISSICIGNAERRLKPAPISPDQLSEDIRDLHNQINCVNTPERYQAAAKAVEAFIKQYHNDPDMAVEIQDLKSNLKDAICYQPNKVQ